LEDIEDIVEALQDEEMDTWTEYDENDIVEEKDIEMKSGNESEVVEEERKGGIRIKAESEIIDETEILTNFMMEFEAKKVKELAVKAEEKKKQLRHLIRVT